MNHEPRRLPSDEFVSTESPTDASDPGINWEQLREHLDAAVAQFLAHDAYLVENDANERSMTHRFAIYLQSRLPEFHVDCEYNRDGNVPKRLAIRQRTAVPDNDTDATTIFPDIIVHERGTRNNILVIEAKKAGRPTERDRDKILAFMTDDAYKYRFGAQLIFQGHPPRIDIQQIHAPE